MKTKKLMLAIGLISSTLYAYDWSGSLLNNNASPADCDVLKDGNGNLIVYGTEGTWSGGHTKEQIFDGNTDAANSFFDPPSAAGQAGGCWAGIGFSRPKVAMRIRFLTRNQASCYPRMAGCYIQGANSADFSDAVTIHVVPGPVVNGWNEQWLNYPNTEYRAYQYFRLLGPTPYVGANVDGTMCGNCAELEFYGFDAEDWPSAADAPAPNLLDTRCVIKINGKMNFQAWATTTANTNFEIQRRLPGDEYSWVAALGGGNSDWQSIAIADNFTGDVYYRMRARNPNGVSRWTEWCVPYTYPNLGNYIGITSSWNNSGNTGHKVYDGDVSTFGDAAVADVNANNVWFGQDFGAERLITSIRYVCRMNNTSFQGAMDGAYFQTADDAAFTENVQTIYNITVRPTEGVPVTVVLDTPVTARYIRYHATHGRYGNAGEIEYSSQIANSPAGVTWVYTNGVITLDWNAYAGNDSRVNQINVYRKAHCAADWTRIAQLDSSATTFTDPNVGWQPVFDYALSYAGTDVEGARCRPVAAGAIRQLERDEADQTKLKAGINVVWRGYPYKVANTADMVLKCFDGDESTCCDLSTTTAWSNGNDVGFGVDLGENHGYILASAKVIGRLGWTARLNGAIIYGSNSPTGDWYNDCEPITEPIVVDDSNLHCEVVGISTNSFRYILIRQPSPSTQFWGNAMELQLFGYKPMRCGAVIIIR